ncbi:caspase domain-containing protein [Leptospira sp. WS58.C1]|uniref:caspase family protein n=1 Tax=Leptospira cinconiae TaxID=3235173 RepID=UPI00349ED921
MKDRVTIFLIGVEEYINLPSLQGPKKDVDKLYKLLVENEETKLYPDSKVKRIINPNSSELRSHLSQYAFGRTADNDILVLYFSGHGVPLGNNDYGLCLKETNIIEEKSTAIPLDLLRFSDIVETLSLVAVDPVFILDSCYSGQAGDQINRSLTELKKNIQREVASSYALLCSSRKYETTPDGKHGGPFCELLVSVASAVGNNAKLKRKEELSLKDLFAEIRKEAERWTDIKPLLFIGDTLPDFSIVRNAFFQPREETMQKSHRDVLLSLWNEGNPTSKSVDELFLLGRSVYTTYSKLSYKPAWALIEKPGKGLPIKLTERGISFMKGDIKIPLAIRRKPESEIWEPIDNIEEINLTALLQL